MNCQRCGKNRLVEVFGKTSDCCNTEYKGRQRDGYVPTDIGLGNDSDVIVLTYCLDCGQIQGKWPLPEPDTSEDTGWTPPVCLTCDGTGELPAGPDTALCHDCGGSGHLPEEGNSPSETGLAHERTRDGYAEGG